MNFSNGLFFIVIAFIFSDLLNVLISPDDASSRENQFDSLEKDSFKEQNRKNKHNKNRFENSSETAASSQKGMLNTQNNSDDENRIQINDFQNESSGSINKSSIQESCPEELFTDKEANSGGQVAEPTMILNVHHSRRLTPSSMLGPWDPPNRTRLNLCLLILVLVILVLLKIFKVGVLSALILGLFMRVCAKSCNGFCMECSPIEWFDLNLGDKNVCGVGLFPSPRLAAKRRMEKERMYQEICAQERQNEEVEKDNEQEQSMGYMSMHIDRKVLYQRLAAIV